MVQLVGLQAGRGILDRMAGGVLYVGQQWKDVISSECECTDGFWGQRGVQTGYSLLVPLVLILPLTSVDWVVAVELIRPCWLRLALLQLGSCSWWHIYARHGHRRVPPLLPVRRRQEAANVGGRCIGISM